MYFIPRAPGFAQQPSHDRDVVFARHGSFQKLGAHFGSPHNKRHHLFGSILGPPVFGDSQMRIAVFFHTVLQSHALARLQAPVLLPPRRLR